MSKGVPAWRFYLVICIATIIVGVGAYGLGKKTEETDLLKAQIIERNTDQEALDEINRNLPSITDSNFWERL